MEVSSHRTQRLNKANIFHLNGFSRHGKDLFSFCYMVFTLSIDYGTNTVRALVVDVSDGRELVTYVGDY